jgi:hypothetical protein
VQLIGPLALFLSIVWMLRDQRTGRAPSGSGIQPLLLLAGQREPPMLFRLTWLRSEQGQTEFNPLEWNIGSHLSLMRYGTISTLAIATVPVDVSGRPRLGLVHLMRLI